MQFIIGFFMGIVVCSVVFIWALKKYMMVAHRFDGDFETLEKAVKEVVPQFSGWSFPIPEWKFYESQQKKGLTYDNIRNMIIHFVCKPAHANTVLREDPVLSAMMPCTWSVYEDDKGHVYIAKMNIPLMSKMYFGTIGEVMRDVVKVESEMFAKIREIIKNSSKSGKSPGE